MQMFVAVGWQGGMKKKMADAGLEKSLLDPQYHEKDPQTMYKVKIYNHALVMNT